MGKMGTKPILPVKQSVSIDTMINFDVHGDGDGDGDGKCKQTFRIRSRFKIKTRELTTIYPIYHYIQWPFHCRKLKPLRR